MKTSSKNTSINDFYIDPSVKDSKTQNMFHTNNGFNCYQEQKTYYSLP